MVNYIKLIYATRRLTPIILLSHMRANTSLFSHILGSNPEINGYYEMHMGYYSWKSLIRQKLKYLEHHKLKPESQYIFDKILHNDHYVNCELLKSNNSKIIISLREPNETIPSIISYYKKINPNHELSSLSGAANYYQERLEKLEHYSFILKNSFIYFDANMIKHNTIDLFRFLERELKLITPLSTDYNIQKLTGSGGSGDRSEFIKLGKLVNKTSPYSTILLDNNSIMSKLNEQYNSTRNKILSNSNCFI